MTFDGGTYDDDRDGDRLRRQFRDVWNFMLDGNWHTLGQIEAVTGWPQASVSARLRDFRKDKFGAHTVNKSYIENGLWEYLLIPNRPHPSEPDEPFAALRP